MADDGVLRLHCDAAQLAVFGTNIYCWVIFYFTASAHLNLCAKAFSFYLQSDCLWRPSTLDPRMKQAIVREKADHLRAAGKYHEARPLYE